MRYLAIGKKQCQEDVKLLYSENLTNYKEKDDKIDILEHQNIPFPEVIVDNDKQINIKSYNSENINSFLGHFSKQISLKNG